MLYRVSVDVTMSKSYYVEASSPDEAAKEVEDGFSADPYRMSCGFDAYVSHAVVDVNEEDEG
ncbi:MAG: hypothetical protein J6Y37_11515 [Paludibacteraceae bacterium]|nr:hypothetical protein [Paludibacteraceae bacterium]